jgi:RalA-binding protein 1
LGLQRGGARLGSIVITGAQIGRQQKTDRAANTDDEKEYRHAFLIVEAKKGPGGNHPRHVLCAESDAERDSWVEMLVRYFSGSYSEEPVSYGGPSGYQGQSNANIPSPSRASSDTSRRPIRGSSKDDVSMLKVGDDYTQSGSPAVGPEASPTDRYPTSALSDGQIARRLLERSQGQPSSLPDTSPLSLGSGGEGQRAASELGHYPDLQEPSRPQRLQSLEQKPREPPPEREFSSFSLFSWRVDSRLFPRYQKKQKQKPKSKYQDH